MRRLRSRCILVSCTSWGKEGVLTAVPDTVHGFAARPSAKHEHTQAMFNEANDDAIVYLKRELGLGGATNM